MRSGIGVWWKLFAIFFQNLVSVVWRWDGDVPDAQHGLITVLAPRHSFEFTRDYWATYLNDIENRNLLFTEVLVSFHAE